MNSYYRNKAKDSEQQAVYLIWLVTIAIGIGSCYCTFKWVTHKCPEPPPPKVMNIIELQEALVDAGYDIGPHGVDGELADCDTVRAWQQYERDVLFNEYANTYMTVSGGPE